ADLRAWPLPGHQPGDPGLAGAVRAWAAVARCSARERLTVAEYALAAVEGRHAAARRDAEEARELDRLQHRHAETARRAELLAQAAPERERVRALLDRARRGALVAPALELRGAAAAAHLTAAHAETLARAELPPALAGAGTEQLAAVEQRLREDLGAAGAAQRAEQRSAEIGRERATLERESRDADERYQESAEWLARWEATRAALQEKVDSAQQALTLAEQLAGRLEPARMQLTAARRRDSLAADAEAAAGELLRAREASSTARETWLELKEARLRGIAAELAAALTAGEPCTVCGSAEHPDPARPAPGHVDRAAEDAAHARFEQAEERRAAVERRLAAVREAEAEAASAAGDATTAELLALTADLSARHAAAHADAAALHTARERLARAEREHQVRSSDRLEAERRAAARASRREALDQEQASLEAELVLVRADSPSVAARARTLEDRIRMVTTAAAALRRAETTAARLKEADDQLADAAFKAGFDTTEQAADAVLPEYERTALQHRLDAWQAEEAMLADRHAERDTAAAAALPPAEPAAAAAAEERAAALLL
ncbi:SMC family ATPase, partial [Streptomyces sp. NPDC127110]